MTNSDHCLRCRTRTPNVGEGITQTSNGRHRRHSKCAGCGGGKSRFLGGKGFSLSTSRMGPFNPMGIGFGFKGGRKQKGGSFFGDLGDTVNYGLRGATKIGLNKLNQMSQMESF